MFRGCLSAKLTTDNYKNCLNTPLIWTCDLRGYDTLAKGTTRSEYVLFTF